jgi:diguanylate cyclase (GGDEF)-like protein
LHESSPWTLAERGAAVKVMLVEDSVADAGLVREMLRDAASTAHELVIVRRLSEALKRLDHDSFDGILVDLGLPDARGLEALDGLQRTAPDVPIVILSGLADEALALDAVRNGAQDYLLKDRIDGATLVRALSYAAERKRAQLDDRYLAQHDSLTGLPNRLLLLDRLEQALARSRRENKVLALLFLDLDNFKTINDTHGHAVGDALLRSVASRLSSCVRKSDTVARIGGDEFMLVLPEVSHVDDVNRFAAKVLDAFKKPCIVGGREEYVSASIGISLLPTDGDTVDALLRAADAAMYRAKKLGGDAYEFHSRPSAVMASERLPLGNRLRFALDAEELALYYQPIVHAQSGAIVAVEALLRWHHPSWGLLLPSRFVPLAEEMGLIIPIGEWVLLGACKQVERWNRSRPGPGLRLAVNLSSRQFNHRNLRQAVTRALDESGLTPASLELELTETGILRDERAAMIALRELSAMGVRTCIDDFGKGESSLSRLRRFPIHGLKIDRAFVQNIDSDESNAAVVEAIVMMARRLQHEVIAEGVETAEQMAVLQQRGCEEMQGHYFSPPLPADEMTEFLHAYSVSG